MLDCLFIGSATKDILMMVDAPPASDQRIAARAVAHACGGIASVAASAFQKLGGRAGLITAVGGSSEVTDFIRADIAGRQLPFVQLVEMDGMDSPFSVIQVERSGKRCITYFGGCIRALTLDMLDKEALKSARMIHLGGLDEGLLVEAAAYAKGHTDALVSVDGGNLSAPCIEAVLPYTDVFIPDDKTVAKTLGLPPEEACRYYAGKGADMVCITLGERGSIALENGVICQAPPIAVQAVDTTGAGDNFHGAFLYALMNKWPLERILRFCNTFSGLTCRGLGGRAAEPTLEETLREMGE